jgi:hypothetical protein
VCTREEEAGAAGVSGWARRLVRRCAQSSSKRTHLGGGVNLGLPSVLALAEHGSSHQLVAILAGNEVGRLEEDGGAVVPREGLPVGLGGDRRLDRLGDELGGGDVVPAEGLLGVSVGLELLENVAGLDLSKGAGRIARGQQTGQVGGG